MGQTESHSLDAPSSSIYPQQIVQQTLQQTTQQPAQQQHESRKNTRLDKITSMSHQQSHTRSQYHFDEAISLFDEDEYVDATLHYDNHSTRITHPRDPHIPQITLLGAGSSGKTTLTNHFIHLIQSSSENNATLLSPTSQYYLIQTYRNLWKALHDYFVTFLTDNMGLNNLSPRTQQQYNRLMALCDRDESHNNAFDIKEAQHYITYYKSILSDPTITAYYENDFFQYNYKDDVNDGDDDSNDDGELIYPYQLLDNHTAGKYITLFYYFKQSDFLDRFSIVSLYYSNLAKQSITYDIIEERPSPKNPSIQTSSLQQSLKQQSCPKNSESIENDLYDDMVMVLPVEAQSDTVLISSSTGEDSHQNILFQSVYSLTNTDNSDDTFINVPINIQSASNSTITSETTDITGNANKVTHQECEIMRIPVHKFVLPTEQLSSPPHPHPTSHESQSGHDDDESYDLLLELKPNININPRIDDIIHFTSKSSGILSHLFTINQKQYFFREANLSSATLKATVKKYYHYLLTTLPQASSWGNTNFLIFTIPLGDFNTILYENMQYSTLLYSIQLCALTILLTHHFNEKFNKNAKMMVLFTKPDLYLTKIVEYNLSFIEHFPDFGQPPHH